jgi:hypothetical protein
LSSTTPLTVVAAGSLVSGVDHDECRGARHRGLLKHCRPRETGGEGFDDLVARARPGAEREVRRGVTRRVGRDGDAALAAIEAAVVAAYVEEDALARDRLTAGI